MIKTFGLSIGDAILLKHSDNLFPTVVSKITNQTGSFIYSFTVPRRVGNLIKNRDSVTFKVVSIGRKAGVAKKDIGYRSFSVRNVSTSSTGHQFFVFNDGKARWLWIYSRGCRPFSLPENIWFKKRNYSLFEVFGAFFCEGLRYRKKGHNLDRLSFSNADPEQIGWFLYACNALFSIPKHQWAAQILFPEKELTKRALSTWVGIGLNTNQIRVCKNKTTNGKCGVCIISISNSTLAEFFFALYEKSKEIALSSRDFSLEFFRGISRGDIGIILKKERIHVITFSTELKEDTEFFIALSNTIGVKTSKPYFNSGCWNVTISSYDNFNKIAALQAITHRRRNVKFLNGLLNANKNVTKKYLEAVAQGKSTTKDAAEFSNVSNITSRFCFSKLFKQGYLKRIQLNKHGAFRYSLSDKGKEILNFHRSLIEEVNGHDY